jgi:hypothetical protein
LERNEGTRRAAKRLLKQKVIIITTFVAGGSFVNVVRHRVKRLEDGEMGRFEISLFPH